MTKEISSRIIYSMLYKWVVRMNKEYIAARKILMLANRYTKSECAFKGIMPDSRTGELPELYCRPRKEYCVRYKGLFGVHASDSTWNCSQTWTEKSGNTARKIQLTEDGIKMCHILHQNGTHMGQELLHGVSESEKEQFINLLDITLHNIEGIAAK